MAEFTAYKWGSEHVRKVAADGRRQDERLELPASEKPHAGIVAKSLPDCEA